MNGVRRTLFEVISSFDGDFEEGMDLMQLIEAQFTALKKSFHLPLESDDDTCNIVAGKLLNMYRTGRLGHYVLDSVPLNA